MVETKAETVTDLLPPLTVSDPGDWATEIEGHYSGVGPSSIILLNEHEDLSLSFDFRLSEGADATLWLHDRYALQLPSLTALAPGGGEANPRLPTDISPDIWQRLEVVFKAPTPSTPALLVAAYLNGNLLHYQQPLGETGEATNTALRMELRAGTATIASPTYLPQAGLGTHTLADGTVQLQLPIIRYRYYELPVGTKDFTAWATVEPIKTGFIDRFDLHSIREKNVDYAIRFDGTLNVPESGEYQFSHWSPASGRVYIDDQLVVDNSGQHEARNLDGKIRLNEGEHTFRWDHLQNGGWNAANISFEMPNGNGGQLNHMNGKISAPPKAEATPVAMDDRPYLLRSFLYFPQPKVYAPATKRTHVISVGEGNGPHYSLDLQNGSLLQVWRGEFADIHNMWDNRGEPQVMQALGQTLTFAGSPQWYRLDEETTPWPDSLSADDAFRHLRHELDAAGRPTFYYAYGQAEVSDQITPLGKGLQRSLHNGGNAPLYVQLASATGITETGPGEFSLFNPGSRLSIVNNAGGRLVLQNGSQRDRLLAEVPADGTIIYDLNW